MSDKKRSLLPYGDNVSAPAITLPNNDLFRSERGSLARNYFENRLHLLNEEYLQLIELARENEMIYKAQYNFVPRVGQIYHLYRIESGAITLSLIEPKAWNKEHLGSYEYTADSIWKRVEK